ncbi:MAG: fatty acid desaturase [Sulfurimonas sp.]|jgi:fatty acid desaturase|uniref:fatty acid desaturase family protein n=1 Tax=Sulfurimonas sp. TaxID=2022749 RepID=UPI0039E69A48
MKTLSTLLRFNDALIPNLVAWIYILVAYISGFAGIMADGIAFNVLGVILLAHSMVIAAYFIHECAHDSLFKKNTHNKYFGEILMWITGASYNTYEAIRHKHVRHHVDRGDIVSFDYREKLLKYPKTLKLIKALEYLYIPAVEIMLHALVLILPFIKPSRKQYRLRVVSALVLRITFFAILASYSLQVLWLYPLSYLIFMTVMRFMDVHQHTFNLHETLDMKRGTDVGSYDRAFEARNTYSNLISESYPWLNLLVLNFSYHNVHHDQQIQPWYRLPALHEKLYGDNTQQVLPFSNLLKSYHDYRVARVLHADPVDFDVKTDEGRHFIGVDGASFLTAF